MTTVILGPRDDWAPDELKAWKTLSAEEQRAVRMLDMLPSKYVEFRDPRTLRELNEKARAASATVIEAGA